jgi:hypothetical protein
MRDQPLLSGPEFGSEREGDQVNGRFIFRVLAALLLVAVVIGVGTAVYNAGVTAGLAEAARQAAASGGTPPVVPYYGYGGPYFHGPFAGGFGFFGVIFWILGFFLILGLVRAAFEGWGRGGRGPGGPMGWGGRREMVEDWHRELHRREGNDGESRATGATGATGV